MKKTILFFILLFITSNINYIYSEKTAEDYFNSGVNKLEKGNYKEAIKDFTRAIKLY